MLAFLFSCSSTAERNHTAVLFCTSSKPVILKSILLEIDDGTKYDAQLGYSKQLLELDGAGNPLKFKSPADALNYMGKKGWKLAEVLPRTSEITTTTYLFKREIKKEEAEVDFSKG